MSIRWALGLQSIAHMSTNKHDSGLSSTEALVVIRVRDWLLERSLSLAWWPCRARE